MRKGLSITMLFLRIMFVMFAMFSVLEIIGKEPLPLPPPSLGKAQKIPSLHDLFPPPTRSVAKIIKEPQQPPDPDTQSFASASSPRESDDVRHDLSHLFRPLVVFDVRFSSPRLIEVAKHLKKVMKTTYHVVFIQQDSSSLEETTKIMLLAPYTLFVMLYTNNDERKTGSITLYTNTTTAYPDIEHPHLEEQMQNVPTPWKKDTGFWGDIMSRINNIHSAMFARDMLARLRVDKKEALVSLNVIGHLSFPLPILNFPLSLGIATLVDIGEPSPQEEGAALWYFALQEALYESITHFLPKSK